MVGGERGWTKGVEVRWRGDGRRESFMSPLSLKGFPFMWALSYSVCSHSISSAHPPLIRASVFLHWLAGRPAGRCCASNCQQPASNSQSLKNFFMGSVEAKMIQWVETWSSFHRHMAHESSPVCKATDLSLLKLARKHQRGRQYLLNLQNNVYVGPVGNAKIWTLLYMCEEKQQLRHPHKPWQWVEPACAFVF